MTVVDERGRVLVPASLRSRVGLKPRSRVVVRAREDGVIEIIPFDAAVGEIAKVFEEKFRGWREEAHEASKLLEKLVELK